MQVFDAAAVRAGLEPGSLVAALARAFAGGVQVPARHLHALPGGATLLLMPAWREGGALAVKAVNVFPANPELGLPAVHGMVLVFDGRTGAPAAVIDGSELTAHRTAAASALAASHLTRRDAKTLLIVGAGRVASLVPAAMRAVRPGLERVVVWNHRPARAEALAVSLCSEGWNAQAATDLESAVREAHIVSCATLSTAPLVRGEWLAPGTHLDLIGSFAPGMREADAAAVAWSRVFIDTDEALAKAGDLLAAIAEGAFEPSRLQGTLAQLVRGERPGRTQDDEITLFKSVGNALEDLAAAEWLLQARR